MFMKYLGILIVAGTALLASSVVQAETSGFRAALGAGNEYGGLGVQLARTTDHDRWSVGAGLAGYSDFYGGAAYGFALSYQRADLIGVRPFEPNRHALGVFIGPIGTEGEAQIRNGLYETRNYKAVWGAGMNYHYYRQGINSPGWSVGFGVGHGSGKHRDMTNVNLALGYQF